LILPAGEAADRSFPPDTRFRLSGDGPLWGEIRRTSARVRLRRWRSVGATPSIPIADIVVEGNVIATGISMQLESFERVTKYVPAETDVEVLESAQDSGRVATIGP
jgi:hypothetical protein